jgi:hypothetical protein
MNQNETAILVAIVGVISTIIGSILTMLANSISSTRDRKKEREKVQQEKIEEIYILANALKYLALSYIEDIASFSGTPFSATPTHIRKNIDNLIDNQQLPIDRLGMLVRFYAPTLKNEVFVYSKLLTIIDSMKNHLDEKILKDLDNTDERDRFFTKYIKQISKAHKLDIKISDDKNFPGVLVAIHLCGKVTESHIALQTGLEKLSSKDFHK